MTVSTASDHATGPRRRPGVTLRPVLAVGTAAAVLVAVGAVLIPGASIAEVLGLPDAGGLTRYGLPAVRVVAHVAAALTVGFLLLGAALVPPQVSGYLDVAGYRAVHNAGTAAAVWTVAALLMVPLTVSEALGRPVVDVLAPGPLLATVPLLPVAEAWMTATLAAAMVLIGCRLVLSWGWTVGLLAVAVAGLLPLAASGHSAVGGSHDIATDSMMLHVVAAAIWVGGLVAVLALALSPSAGRVAVALPRFSAVAAGCWALLAVSGSANLAVRVPLGPEILLSTYGVLAAAKVAALLLLGAVGHLHRRRTLPTALQGDRRSLLRLGGAEVVLLLATIGLAVGLGRTAPPAPAGEALPSRTGEVLGYDLAVPGADFLLAGRPDLVFGLLAAGLFAAYVAGVRRTGGGWPVLRTAAWTAGCLLVVFATSSGLGRYGSAMLGVGAVGQVLLAFVVPALLAAGAPLRLARRALPLRGRRGTPSPRGSVAWVLRRPAVRSLLRPGVAVGVFAGTLAAMPLGLFDLLLPTQGGRQAVDALLLSGGCLVAAALSDRRRAVGATGRIPVAVVLALPAVVGGILLARSDLIAEAYFRSLALPWVPDLAAEQARAGVVWILGVLVALPLLLVLRPGRGHRPRAGR